MPAASLERMAPASPRNSTLAALRLTAGEGRRLELEVPIEPLSSAASATRRARRACPVELEVSRMTGGGYALHLRFAAALSGPCMRCLKDAAPLVEVDAREVDRPAKARSWRARTSSEEKLDLAAWAHDAFALAAPAKVLCREDCAGLCPVCAADLNEAGPEHHHETAPDPRWAKLRELKLD